MRVLLLGIGSDHGDDACGWKVIDRITGSIAGVEYHKIATPIESIDLLESAAEMHMIDAASGMQEPFEHLRYSCPSDRKLLAQVSTTGTHDFGLDQTLQLAESLGRPTDHVHLWLVSGHQFGPLAPMSLESTDATLQCAQAILQFMTATLGCRETTMPGRSPEGSCPATEQPKTPLH